MKFNFIVHTLLSVQCLPPISNGNQYTVSKNGTYVVTVTLNNGKSSTKTITISNIDKEKPIVADIQLGTPATTTNGVDVYDLEPTLTIIAFDMGTSGIKKIEYQLNNGDVWNEYLTRENVPTDYLAEIKKYEEEVLVKRV